MKSSAAVLFVCALGLNASEGTKVRRAAADYPVHAASPDGAIAAEYTVRSVMAEPRSVFLKDHLAVEVALFPSRSVPLSMARFQLRVNGQKGILIPEPVAFVAAALKYPDWEGQRGVVVAAGPVILGRPPAVGRFPGDPQPAERTSPRRRPEVNTSATGAETQAGMSDAEVVEHVALREGTVSLPVSGYLYFAYKGKLSKLKSVELLYQPGPGSEPVVLKLR